MIKYNNMTFPQGKKIRGHFPSEFDSIHANLLSKKKLNNSIGKIDGFAFKRRIDILKKAGIPVAIVALLIIQLLGIYRHCRCHFMVY